MTRRALVVTHRTRPEAVEAKEIVLRELAQAGVEPVLASDATTPDGLPARCTAVSATPSGRR